MQEINIVVNGALGSMGREVVLTVLAEKGFKLVGAVDVEEREGDVGLMCGAEKAGVEVSTDLKHLLGQIDAHVVIDFTTPLVVMENIRTILNHKVRPVVGTTGITDEDLPRIKDWVEAAGVGCFISANFSLGAVLLLYLASRAAPYMESVEIIETHHPEKMDVPSGTAIRAADIMADGLAEAGKVMIREEKMPERVAGARGGSHRGIAIHSLRLPGTIAQHEILMGCQGQTLSLKH